VIRIVYLIDHLFGSTGGTEKQMLRTLELLDRRRFEPWLLTLQPSPWLQAAQLPFPQRTLGFRSFRGLDFRRCGRRFVDFCREQRIDIVQCFFLDSCILGPYWCRQAGVPTVISSRRNIGADYWHTWLNIRVLRHVARYTTHYIANSDAAAEETVRVEGVDRERISVLPNCLDLDAFVASDPEIAARRKREWGFAPDTLLVGAVANLRPVKNLPFLVRAAARVASRLPQVGFVVLGEGPQRGELEGLVRSLGLGSRFVLPGVSNDVARDLQAFDVCALCSFGESSSNSIVEGMAAGKPCVVSQVGGNGELVRHGETGYLYPGGDVDRCVDLLIDLLEDPAKRADMGSRAAAAARSRFDARVVIPQLERLYETLLERRAALPV